MSSMFALHVHDICMMSSVYASHVHKFGAQLRIIACFWPNIHTNKIMAHEQD